jgi:carbamoylphosphate synthase large subunit
VVNYNPETVSTDYDESDRLYFEELSLERVLDISDRENPEGVIVSVGGQIPNNLAMPLCKAGVNILGTVPESWAEVTDLNSALDFAKEVQYPVLVRPSYVLSGAGMIVASDEEQLKEYLSSDAVKISRSISVSRLILNTMEIEFDGVAKDGSILNYAMS